MVLKHPQSVTISQGNICKILGFSRFTRHCDEGTLPKKFLTEGRFFYLGLEMGGERDRIRTCDPVIKSHLLYQLSYAPTKPYDLGQVTVGTPQSLDPVLPNPRIPVYSFLRCHFVFLSSANIGLRVVGVWLTCRLR